MRYRKKLKCGTRSGKSHSIEIAFMDTQMSDLVDKDFKEAIKTVFKEQ